MRTELRRTPARARRGRALVAAALLAGLASAPRAARAERALVVLGSALTPQGTPGPTLQRRLDATLRLARQDPGARVVVTGGAVTHPVPEGQLMARWLRERGVAPQRILVESRARHTGENADLVVPLLAAAGVRQVTLVTDRHHLRRARFHLNAALRGAGLRDVKVQGHAVPDGKRGLRGVKAWAKESLKLVRDAWLRSTHRTPQAVLGAAR